MQRKIGFDEAYDMLEQLEKSEDLITWTNAGDAVQWMVPVGASNQFFRVRAEP